MFLTTSMECKLILSVKQVWGQAIDLISASMFNQQNVTGPKITIVLKGQVM